MSLSTLPQNPALGCSELRDHTCACGRITKAPASNRKRCDACSEMHRKELAREWF